MKSLDLPVYVFLLLVCSAAAFFAGAKLMLENVPGTSLRRLCDESRAKGCYGSDCSRYTEPKGGGAE